MILGQLLGTWHEFVLKNWNDPHVIGRRRKAGARLEHPGRPTESTSQLGKAPRSDLLEGAAQVAGTDLSAEGVERWDLGIFHEFPLELRSHSQIQK